MATPMCLNCKNHPVHARGRCHTCYRYWLRLGIERPLTMRRRLTKVNRFYACTNCQSKKIVALNLCGACYIYQKKHNGEKRPRYLFKNICKNCGYPIRKIKHGGSLCYNCSRQERQNL